MLRATIFVALALAGQSMATAVFAHFMAQNSYSYTIDDWAADIKTAKDTGIDGFALNIAANDYEVTKISDAYAAAEAAGFKLFYSFDLSYTWDATTIVNIVAQHSSSASTYKWNNKVLVSTFNGEAKGNDFWASVKSQLSAKGIPISFAPAFTSYRDPSTANSLLSNFLSVDGFFNWWSWPADVNSLLTTDTDIAFQKAVKTRTGPYIMGVSPWQFKDLGVNGGDWVEQSDTLWKYRWEQAISVKPDIVEIITWNDYGESHYIGDINPKVDLGTDAPKYVNGFVHAPWRIMAKYYISWYKTGTAPTITNDQLVFWYRSHPKGVSCSGGNRPRNADFPADAVFAVALLASPATVTLDIGLNNHVEWNAPAGVSIGQVPFPQQDSQIPFLQIKRNGATVKSGYGSVYVTNSCSYYNFNPFVGVVG